MLQKRIIVLANSLKNRGRCVAGREPVPSTGAMVLRGWVRPVSTAPRGVLDPWHYVMENGEPAGILDIVEMTLCGPASDEGQPENWRIDETTRWRKMGEFPIKNIGELIERPTDLWLGAGDQDDRLSVEEQRERRQWSLALIEPERLRIRLWQEPDPQTNGARRKTRAVFTYRGVEYALSITDPRFLDQRCPRHPRVGAPAIEAPAWCKDRCVLCVSLTPPFHGYHYKVVATILELP